MKEQHFYFCTECKKHLDELQGLLFVEDLETKGFCSVECAEDFHYPIVRYFKDYEIKLRKELGLKEKEDGLVDHKEFLNSIYSSPHEVYRYQNTLGERLHFFIRKFNDSYGVSVASMYQGDISIVLATIVTESLELVEKFRLGDEITTHYLQSLKKKSEEISSKMAQSQKDEELMAELEAKKSSVLAEILGLVKTNDIQIEDYAKYDYCFDDTFSYPEEIFQNTDNVGDKIECFIKTYSSDDLVARSFYFIVIALRVKTETHSNLYPVLGFPTTDIDIYYHFARGKKVSGITFN